MYNNRKNQFSLDGQASIQQPQRIAQKPSLLDQAGKIVAVGALFAVGSSFGMDVYAMAEEFLDPEKPFDSDF